MTDSVFNTCFGLLVHFLNFVMCLEPKRTVGVDDLSLLTKLRGKKQAKPDLFYWGFHAYAVDQKSIRKGKWKAVRVKIKKANTPTSVF